MLKRALCTRGMTHGKLHTVALKNKKVPKKNDPDESTMFKRKKGEFDAMNCVTFKNDQAKETFNFFVMENNLPEFKVELQVKNPSENPEPKLLNK